MQKDKRKHIYKFMDTINTATITLNCSVAFRKRFMVECRARGLSPNKAGILAIKHFFGFQEFRPKEKLATSDTEK